MKKNTLIISVAGSVLLIVFIIILVIVLRSGREIVYEEGVPNVAVTDFTKSMGKDLIKGLFPEVTASINTMSFDAAFESLVNGTNDVVLAMKPSEEMLNYSQDVMVEVEVIPIAKDALIVMNNRYNPVKNMTYDQFRKIYSGELKNWKDLEGSDLEILPYLNTASYDSYFALKEVMNGAKLVTPKLTLKSPSFANIVKAIGTYEDTADYAVGYGMFYDIDDLFGNKNIQILSINGVTPTLETVKSGEYPLNVNIYAMIRKDSAENSRARRLVNFILSEEGQNIIEKDGYFKIK